VLCRAVTLALFMQLTDSFRLLTDTKYAASRAYLKVLISLTWQRYSSFYFGTRAFVIAYTTARDQTLSWTNPQEQDIL
jgi:hypothetical protein